MLEELYREIILDHYRSPRNRGELSDADARARGRNPVCGDDVTLYLKVCEGTITAARSTGNGCAISQASSSILSQAVVGRSLEEALGLVAAVEGMMRGGPVPEGPQLDDLAALEGVRKFPARIKCALLAWETLKEAVLEYQQRQAGNPGVSPASA
ncbi:MAG: iron-sulfur cluster assembly scaffold protein NifU [Dehalococcoidia bacterium]|nr:MAG: iron-sulfur cluster assembly scaffold protein NifU [Dehalococcoidia bacterium]